MTVDSSPTRAARPAAERKHRAPAPRRRRERKTQLLPYTLIAPALLFELLVHIIPMLVAAWISFHQLGQLTLRRWLSAPFVGFDNYSYGLDTDGPIGHDLVNSLLRTLAFTAIVLCLTWGLGMLAAVLANSRFRGRTFFRALFLVPFVLPTYVTANAFVFMFNQRDGAINSLLVDVLGILDEKPFWMLGEQAFWVTVLAATWRLWPFAFLMLLAALQNIPDDLYEAAELDGASLWRQFRGITLPLVAPANRVLLLVMGLWTFNDFNMPYLLFGSAPPPSANLLSLQIYQHSFVNWNFGLGAAMSMLLLVVLMIVTVFYVRMVLPKKEDQHA